ncbi:hypothetical protein SASPL_137729 [Salvia splendens]|uniref:Large ribosomal subunit protein uL15/eL18 domain-containing protein n=1 Tax=Salvia splendens TaxID=180675 RepID=A0A8X8WVD6_SALSN|nr:hypothetical protein SASPL_137729 [Salvia splendens]
MFISNYIYGMDLATTMMEHIDTKVYDERCLRIKVLGKGMLPDNLPVVVKAKLISKTAEKKIKEAGGAVLLTA